MVGNQTSLPKCLIVNARLPRSAIEVGEFSMRNAAMVLGLIAGVMGIFVGLFGFGYSELAAARPEVNEIFSL